MTSKEKSGPDAEGDEARKILAKRGLTKTVIDEAKQLLARAGKLESIADVPPAAANDDDFDKAERQLWDWYLEWSTIVQTAIKDHRILRELGFRRTSSSKAATAEEPADGEEAEDESDAEIAEPAVEAGAFLTGASVAAAGRKGR